MKRLLAAVLAFFMLLGLAGCGGEKAETGSLPADGKPEETVSSEIKLDQGWFSEPVEFICWSAGSPDGEGEPEVIDSLFFFPEGYCVYMGRVRNMWPCGTYYIEGDRIFTNFTNRTAPFYFLIREGGILPLQGDFGYMKQYGAGVFWPENQMDFTYPPEELLQRTREEVEKNGGKLDPDFAFGEAREYIFAEPGEGSGQDTKMGDLIFYPNGYCYWKGAPGEEWPAGQYALDGDTVYIVFNGSWERIELKLYGDRLQTRTEKEDFWTRGSVWERNPNFAPEEAQNGYLYWGTSLTGAELDNRWILEMEEQE